jgi:hypothetical protein
MIIVVVMTPPLSALEYMDYDKFRDMLDTTPPFHIYEDLMAKERRVLDTINRLANERTESALANSIKDMSIFELVRNIAKANYEVVRDLMAADSVVFFMKTITAERMVYLGFTMIAFALFLVIVMMST